MKTLIRNLTVTPLAIIAMLGYAALCAGVIVGAVIVMPFSASDDEY